MKQDIINLAQGLLRHAQTGPGKAGQRGKVANSLSPHLEHLYVEMLRNHIIKTSQAARTAIMVELAEIRELLPSAMQPQFDLTTARITEILQTIYK